jgi:Flp pilus assembly protein CpaB
VRNLSGLTSRRPFTLLGIVLALLVIAAFVLVALNAGSASNSPQITVVVTTKDLQPRLSIDAASLALKTISVPAGYPKVYFTRIEDVQGLVPLVTIVSGQAVTSNDVTKPSQALGSQSEFLPIPSGYVALTIPTSEEQGVAFYPQADDYISVIATVSSSGKVASKTIFTQIHIIRVGVQSTGAGNAGGANVSSLTIVVTQCQAEVITWFLTYASLKYTLEAYPDYHPNSTPDPACASVAAAQGATLQTIEKAYPSLF